MKAFIKHVKKQFIELDRLAAIWEHLDDPLDSVRYVVEETADRAARLGLADLYKKAPSLNKLTFKDARWYLAECLKAGKAEPEAAGTTLTVTEVAGRLKVNRDKVLGWIHYGRLRAVNTAKGTLGRPRYRIKTADLEDFLAGRTGRA
jgi:excisionase family DNA binding protein